MEKFINFVAERFECDPSELTLDTSYGVYEKWDSIMMLRLTMEIEDAYNVSIPIEAVGKIKTLSDLYEYVRAL